MLKLIGTLTMAPDSNPIDLLPEEPPTRVMVEPVPPLIELEANFNAAPLAENEVRFNLTLGPKVTLVTVRVRAVAVAVVKVYSVVLKLNAP
jgi:hypothetical protein